MKEIMRLLITKPLPLVKFLADTNNDILQYPEGTERGAIDSAEDHCRNYNHREANNRHPAGGKYFKQGGN